MLRVCCSNEKDVPIALFKVKHDTLKIHSDQASKGIFTKDIHMYSVYDSSVCSIAVIVSNN